MAGVPMVLFGEGETRATGIFFLFMPFIMGTFGFVGIVLFGWVYNVLAKVLGGIEFDLDDVGE